MVSKQWLKIALSPWWRNSSSIEVPSIPAAPAAASYFFHTTPFLCQKYKIMDGFWSSRWLNDCIDLSYKVGSFLSGTAMPPQRWWKIVLKKLFYYQWFLSQFLHYLEAKCRLSQNFLRALFTKNAIILVKIRLCGSQKCHNNNLELKFTTLYKGKLRNLLIPKGSQAHIRC